MRRFSVILTISAVLCLATPALAAPKTDDPIEEAATARFAEGMKLYSKKKYEQARASFIQAYALKKSPNTLLMLAQVFLKLGKPLDTLKFYEAYLKQVPEPTEKNKAIIENGKREARAMLGHIKVTAPDGAEITVDGEAAVKAPLKEPIDVAPGPHTVKVTVGDDEKVESIELAAGASVDVAPKFKPKPVVGPPPAAKQKAPTPLPPASNEGEPPSILSPPATVWPVYAAAVVGMGSMAVAAITAGLKYNADYAVSSADGALNRAGTTRVRCTQPYTGTDFEEPCDTIAKNESISRDLSGVVTASLIAGSTAFAIGVAYYLFAPKEGANKEGESRPQPKPDSRATPWLGPGMAGVSLSGSF